MSYIKVIGSRSHGAKERVYVSCLRVVCLRLKGDLVSSVLAQISRVVQEISVDSNAPYSLWLSF